MNRKKLLVWLLILSLAACTGQKTPAATSVPSTTNPTAASLPMATATPQPRELTICTRLEPTSLYPYDGYSSLSKQTALMLLSGTLPGQIAPNPLELVESRREVVTLSLGDMVMDSSGQIVPLVAGLKLWPAGCHSPECAFGWDGNSEFKMDQMVYIWRVQETAAWQDGTPLKAKDYWLGNHAASSDPSRMNRWYQDITASLHVEDEAELIWKLVPGMGRFAASEKQFPWTPLPSHLLEGIAYSDFASQQILQESLPAWGPYLLEHWNKGTAMHFVPNPGYPAERSGLWAYDAIELRFLSEQSQVLAAFSAGECDILDGSYRFTAAEIEAHGASASLGRPEELSMLVMGVKPASYDDGQPLWSDEEPDFFGSLELRKALWACLDLNSHFEDLAASFYPTGYQGPRFKPPVLPALPEPRAALEALGWQDADGDPNTPRLTKGVEGVKDGTPFKLRLLSGQSAADAEYAAFIVKQLGSCGIAVEHQALSPQELYAPGPEGPLFGRSFDLAIVYFQSSGLPFCLDQTALAVPKADNNWVGMNISGFSDPLADAACFSDAGVNEDDSLTLTHNYVTGPLIPHPEFWLGLETDKR
jgi:peptide/nickel transport system substrate-binding protein